MAVHAMPEIEVPEPVKSNEVYLVASGDISGPGLSIESIAVE